VIIIIIIKVLTKSQHTRTTFCEKLSATLETGNWDPVATIDSFILVAAQAEIYQWQILLLQAVAQLV
jgi:hypothetical protein